LSLFRLFFPFQRIRSVITQTACMIFFSIELRLYYHKGGRTMTVKGSGLNGLARETRDVLLQPARYFSTMSREGTIGSAMLKVFIYSVAVLLLSVAANLLYPRPGFSAAALIAIPLIAVLALFLCAAILMIFSLLCGGSTDFTLNVRVAASLSALCVVQALLTLPTRPGSLFSTLLWLAVSAYGIVLLYFALIHGLAGKEGQVKVLSGALAGVFVIFGIASLAAQVFLKGVPGKIAGIADEQSPYLRVVKQKLKGQGYTDEDFMIAEEYQKAADAGDVKKSEELLTKMQENQEKRNAAKQ
jgi:hypothetical protein